MKKRTLIVAALLAAMTVGANAQENLALNKEATASSNETNAGQSVDGNTGTRWEQNGESAGDVTSDNSFWYSVDLTGENDKTVDFDLVQILWENNNVKKFKIFTSNDGTNWTDVYTSPTGEDNSGTKNYEIGNQNARYIKIKATELNGTNYFSFWEFRVMKKEAAKLTTVKPNIGFVKDGTSAALSFTCADQYGENITDFTATCNSEDGTFEKGIFTPKKSGKVTFTVKSGDTSIEVPVYVLTDSDAPVLALNSEENDYYGIYGSSELNAAITAGWANQYVDANIVEGEMTLGNTPVKQVANLKKILIGKDNNGDGSSNELGIQNTNLYEHAIVALYSDQNVEVTVQVEASAGEGGSKNATLEAGKWNYVDVTGFTKNTTFKFIDVLYNGSENTRPNILVSNVYLYGPKHTASVLTTVTPSAAFVKNEESALTFNCLDQYNGEMTDYTVSTEDGTYENGKFTPNKTGKATFNVTSGETTVQASVYVMGENEAPVLSLDKDKYDYKGLYGSSELGCDNSQVGWESGYRDATVVGEMTIGTTPAMQLSKLNKILVGNSSNGELGLKNDDGYTDVTIAVFSDRDATTSYRIEASTEKAETVKLEAGKWCYFTISGFTTETTFKYIDLEGTTASDGSRPNVLISNIYFHKEKSGVVKGVEVSSTANARGFYSVTGKATSVSDINEKLQDATITAYDLTGLDRSEITEACTLTPANHNALIYVKAADGKGGNDFEPAQDWGETKNIVGFNNNSADEYYKPATGINLEDGYAVYQGWFISAGDRAVNYTRSLNAGDCVSTFLPRNAELPAGCKAYEFVKGSNDNTIDLNEVTALSENTPYVIYNGNSDKVDLTCVATSDVYFTKAKEKETEKVLGNVTVKGNYSYFAGDGTQYVLDATSYNANTGVLTLKKCTKNTTIVPFRVYFTLNDATKASVVKFMLPGTVTGINDVKANAQKAADVYSIDGRLVKKAATSVEGLASGVYIMNGKKYVVK